MGDPVFSLQMNITGEWRTAVRGLQRSKSVMAEAQRKALRQEGEVFRGHVITGIKEQAPAGKGFMPISLWTIATRRLARRRSTKALIEKGDLLRNVKVHQISSDTVFVGLRRGVVNSEGREVANIGELNEFGTRTPILIKISPAMAKFLVMLIRKMIKAGIPVPPSKGKGDGYLHITIPPRPFFGPVFEKLAPGVRERVMERMVKLMGGVFAPAKPTPLSGPGSK